jgi:hypothetical protein
MILKQPWMQLLLNLQQMRLQLQLLLLLAVYEVLLRLQSCQDICKEQCTDQQGGSHYVHKSAQCLC